MAEAPVALSIRQPWAELILSGRKTIELRSWNTKRRGEFYIHASEKMGPVEKAIAEYVGLNPRELVRGAIVGKADLVDVRDYETHDIFVDDKYRRNVYRRFFEDADLHLGHIFYQAHNPYSVRQPKTPVRELSRNAALRNYQFQVPHYGFMLENIERLSESVQYKGKLGFFSVADVVRKLNKQ